MKHLKNFDQIVTLQKAHAKDGRNLTPEDLSIVNNASIIYDEKEIIWVGETAKLPSKYDDIPAMDQSNYILIPQMVDSHTHIAFGGDRSLEYGMRLNGATYEEIAAQGQGILNTVQATREFTFDQLFDLTNWRFRKMQTYGVEAIEIKSGYGLNYEREKLISEVIHKLKIEYAGDMDIYNTFMAAHAIPEEYKDANSYLDEVVIPLMQELAERKIIDFVDIFHEKNYFSTKDVKKLFDAAKELKLKLKIHADELNDNNGASLAVDYNCISADHLLCVSNKNIKKLAASNTVATILPGTALFLGKPLPPARKLLDAGCKVAMASDFNPGSCHFDNLPKLAAITGMSLKMNIAELLASITLNAAAALDLHQQGVIAQGFKPKFSILRMRRIEELFYKW